MGKFNPDGTGYDYTTARKYGMKPNKSGHWGSVVRVAPRKYLVLKGKQHETWDKMKEAEYARGYRVRKLKDGRYYSIKGSSASRSF
jgi:hypothetical protein